MRGRGDGAGYGLGSGAQGQGRFSLRCGFAQSLATQQLRKDSGQGKSSYNLSTTNMPAPTRVAALLLRSFLAAVFLLPQAEIQLLASTYVPERELAALPQHVSVATLDEPKLHLWALEVVCETQPQANQPFEREIVVGCVVNAYLFAGEALDPNSGWYYNRARWMQPQLGRFASADSHPGGSTDPISLHRYLYASLDPVGKMDPTGLFTGADVMASLASIANIARIATPIALPVYQGVKTALLLTPLVIDRVLTWAEVVGGVLGLLDLAAEGATWLDQATRALVAKKHNVPEGWSSRGFYFEEVTRPNLGKSFPTIDHLDEEGRLGISQRSHMSEHPNSFVRMDRLVSAVGRDLRELDGIEQRGLAGNSVMGWREYEAGAVRIRGLLVIVPETDAASLSFATGRIAQLARQYQTVVKVVPARGWRPGR